MKYHFSIYAFSTRKINKKKQKKTCLIFLLNFDYFWQFLAANSLRTHMDFQNFEKFQKHDFEFKLT